MEVILQWGLDCIRLVQTWANPVLTVIMRAITRLGSVSFCMVLIPFIYWCINEKKGLRLGITVLISVWINLALKFLLEQPRPFFPDYDPSVGMIAEKLGGFPSGHAQTSLVMWMIIASWGKKKYFFGIAAFFCLMVGFSRIYLGVHFPTDVFGGWLLGGIVLCAYFLAGDRIETFFADQSPRNWLIACSAVSFVMILYRPSVELLMPAGMLLGLGTGYFLCRRYIGFTANAAGRISTAKYIMLLVRYALGITTFILLYIASSKIIAGLYESDNYQLIIFLHFILLTMWISAGAPWIFRLLRLGDN